MTMTGAIRICYQQGEVQRSIDTDPRISIAPNRENGLIGTNNAVDSYGMRIGVRNNRGVILAIDMEDYWTRRGRRIARGGPSRMMVC